MVDLSYVKTKNKLKFQQYNDQLKKHIIEKVKELDNLGPMKNDHMELLTFICTCVENGLNEKYEKKHKTDKKKLVLQIFEEIFNSLNEDEKKKLGNSIDFLISNDLVKKVNIAKRCAFIGFNYIKSKL